MSCGWSVVVAPDSFKGSLTAREAAGAIARGARRALGSAATIRTVPMADGGEGTLEALLAAWEGHERHVEVSDALGRPRPARYGLSADGATAVIEAAEANGLLHVSDLPAQPLGADSAGVGELVLAALEAGAEEILLCLGGSATTDGGTGTLRALGARFLDAAGRPVEPGGAGLARIASIDLAGLDPRARAARWRIAVDVDNPLVGPRGAAAVFGPQKGATPDDVAALDAGLAHLAQQLVGAVATPGSPARAEPGQLGAGERGSLTAAEPGPPAPVDLLDRPGMGAAGGLPACLVALLGAELVPGSRLVAEAIGLQQALAGADIVLTGEGSFDAQSLHGKVVDAVREAAPEGAAIVVVAGRVALSAAEVAAAGLTAALAIARGPAGEEELQRDAAELVAQATETACRLLAPYRPAA